MRSSEPPQGRSEPAGSTTELPVDQRAAKAEIARQTIALAAIEEFDRKGFSNSAITDIAQRAGTSVGLIYYHFGSKSDLFHSIWGRYQSEQDARVRAVLDEARAGGVTDAAQLLLVGARAYMEGAWADRAIARLQLRDTPPTFKEQFQQLSVRWQRRNARLVRSSDHLLHRTSGAAINAALGALRTEVLVCRSDAEAAAVIERGIEVLAALVVAFQRLDPESDLVADLTPRPGEVSDDGSAGGP